VTAGAHGIYQRVAIANVPLSGAQFDTGNIVDSLGTVDRHLISICRSPVLQVTGLFPQAGAASVQNTVVAINSKVDGITTTARTISTTASALATTVADIQNIAASIQDSARGINTSFATLFPVTQMIAYGPPPYGLNTINLNVDRIIVRALDIQADLNNIVVTVPEIDRHAASICRSILVMGPRCGPPVAPGTPAPIYRPAEGAAAGTGTR
jgi:hypothetical protein